MRLIHLSLANFRNYVRLDLPLPSGISLFVGANAQGKSNLLEAIYYLATTRSYRSTSDRELINWLAIHDPLPYARLVAHAERATGRVQVEVVIVGTPQDQGNGEGLMAENELGMRTTAVQKRVKVNGVPRRAIDLLGQINVVMFTPQDLDLVAGAPALRRRYLDITLAQTNPEYVRALQRYNRVVLQRNSLLKQAAVRRHLPDELAFWNDELVEHGSYIISQRKTAVSLLDELAYQIHGNLTGASEHLHLVYRCSVQGDSAAPSALADCFRSALRGLEAREMQAGISLIGPHRDDLAFLVDGVDMRIYGSRGQQRTIALALKFAEAAYIQSIVGDSPVMLLDDLLSELDAARRQWLLAVLTDGRQVLLTATDTDHYPVDFLRQVDLFHVEAGRINHVARDPQPTDSVYPTDSVV